MTPHEQLVAAIQARMGQKSAEFNSGILTADRYLRTLQDCVGSDLCNRYCSKGNISWHDQIKRAASMLTYNNLDMIVEDQYSDWKKDFSSKDIYGEEIELPKNTLMVFKHILTSPKKDRDGDTLRTQGARPDPNMLMIYQHQHSLPIGKMLGIHEHTSKKLSPISAIVDINDLAHDSAVMIDNKMGRFSHGFKALDFSENKGTDSDGRAASGFDIKSFEIMEESLVSVPSNTDAEVEEVIFSLVSGGKMTSTLMKSYGKTIKSRRNLTLNVPGDYSAYSGDVTQDEYREFTHDTKTIPTETKCGCGCGGKPETCSGKPAPEKTDDSDGKEISSDKSEIGERCPKCGESMSDGKCKCGYTEKSGSTPEPVELTAKEAMAVFIAKATPQERNRMAETIKVLDQIDNANRRGKQYEALRSHR